MLNISQDKVVQIVYDGNFNQCDKFQFLVKDNIVKTIDASNKFYELIYTNSDGGFEEFDIKCMLTDKSLDLQYFIPVAFGSEHTPIFSIYDYLQVYSGSKMVVGSCENCIFINIEPSVMNIFIERIFEITLAVTIPISIVIAVMKFKKKR